MPWRRSSQGSVSESVVQARWIPDASRAVFPSSFERLRVLTGWT